VRNKPGDGGEVGPTVTGERDESDVVAAGAFYPPATDNALGVGKQDSLEQHGGRVGGCTGGVVAKTVIETAKVDLMVEQVVQGVFDSTGDELPLQVNCKKPRATVDVLVTGHGGASSAGVMR